jgi:protein TonB
MEDGIGCEKIVAAGVVLFVVVGTNGCPAMIKVARALGMGLDESAIDAVKKWRWQPATRDGRPVAVQMNLEVTFTVPDRRPK